MLNFVYSTCRNVAYGGLGRIFRCLRSVSEQQHGGIHKHLQARGLAASVPEIGEPFKTRTTASCEYHRLDSPVKDHPLVVVGPVAVHPSREAERVGVLGNVDAPATISTRLFDACMLFFRCALGPLSVREGFVWLRASAHRQTNRWTPKALSGQGIDGKEVTIR